LSATRIDANALRPRGSRDRLEPAQERASHSLPLIRRANCEKNEVRVVVQVFHDAERDELSVPADDGSIGVRIGYGPRHSVGRHRHSSPYSMRARDMAAIAGRIAGVAMARRGRRSSIVRRSFYGAM
jgi:hypothetical protein